MQTTSWKLYEGGGCPNCGGDLLVNSTCPKNEDFYGVYVNDGDEIKCMECHFKSAMNVDEGIATVQEGNLNDLP